MSILNNGSQIITFDYEHPAKGDNFNTLLRGVVKPGFYSGSGIIDAGSNDITIPTFNAYLNVGTDKVIHVSTSENFDYSATPASDLDYLYMTYTWSDTIENWLDFAVRDVTSDVVTNEVILGTIVSSGGTISSVNSNGRTLGLFDEDYAIAPDLTFNGDTTFNGSFTNSIKVNQIDESTTNSGVVIEGVHLEDNKIGGTYHIQTQAQFDTIIEEVSGTQWKFIDAVTSVVFDNLSGGYQMDDDDDYLEMNNCKYIEMRGGAFFDFNDGIGYIKVDSTGCYLRNVDVQGNGSAGAVVQSFLLSANHVTYDNCKCSNRLSSVATRGFMESSTAFHNVTSKYMNCSVFNISGSNLVYGFDQCENLFNCFVYDLDSSSGTNVCYGYFGCDNLTGCRSYQLNTGSGECCGFDNSDYITNCIAQKIESATGTARGFSGCGVITGAYSAEIESGGSGDAFGLHTCSGLSSIRVYGVVTDSGDSYGFYNCAYFSGCTAEVINSSSGSDFGFHTCSYGASSYTSETCSTNTFINANTDEFSCPTGFTP